MDVVERLQKGSRRSGATLIGLGVLIACAALAIATTVPSVDLSAQLASFFGVALLFAVGVAVVAVGRWVSRNGTADVVDALQNDPLAIVSLEYKHLRSFQLFRPDRHHLVFQLRDTRSTVSVREDDVTPIMDFVRTRSPNATISRVGRYGPA